MAEAAVSIALGTLRDLLSEEGRFLLGVSSEVKQLQTQLKEIKCFLEDADKKQHQSKTVKNWIKEIRDLAYRSEDVILEYAARISSDRQGGLRRLGKIFYRVLCKCSSLHQIGSEVSDIKHELSRLRDEMRDEGIRRIIDEAESSAAGDKENKIRKTFPNFEIGDCFVGMEDELKRVLPLLLKQEEDEQHRVISIWGMGGIGKTTFAKRVYNDEKNKKERFNSFAWVCISQQFNVRSVLEDVLKQLDPRNGKDVSSLSETQLIDKLCQIQRDEQCMIVLDDLWKISHWNQLKSAFCANISQSKILVTTRNQEVATHVGFALELRLLNMNNAWELLKKKAFPRNDVPEFASQEDFERIGKEMVKRCGYLPLAISLLGGVLSKKNRTIGDWKTVNEDINGSLYKSEGHDDNENPIDPVLNLSYSDLPYRLKSCFLYLGILKEDETIFATNLYNMWIAQGMISDENSGGNNSLTDTAEGYLTELASRSMVQIEVDEYCSDDDKTCRLHDVVRELCLSICEKEDFVVRNLDYPGDNLSSLPHISLSHAKIRHLRIHLNEELQQGGNVHPTNLDTCKNLRSLEIINWGDLDANEFPPQSILDFRKFKLLRCLAIEGFSFPKRKLPKGITTLVLLRYLRLRDCELDSLPKSINRLVYLDTLDLEASMDVRIRDHVFKKKSRLKYLVLPMYSGETIGNYRLELDEGVEGLESLMGFNSSKHELKCIKKMKSLRRLSARIFDNESLSAITNAMSTNWNKLSYCELWIQPACKLTENEEGLVMLKQLLSCPGLYTLVIHVQLGKLLKRCIREISCSKLVSLEMKYCNVVDDPMGILGKLHSLRVLCLGGESFVGKTMTSPASSFPQLEVIMIYSLTNLEEWIVEQGAMPVVSEICLEDCPCLQKVPDGFSSLSSLQKLSIRRTPILKSRLVASAADLDGVDFHKVSHVPKILYDYRPLSDA